MHSAHRGIGGFDNITRRGGIGLIVIWLMLLLSAPAFASSSHDDDDHTHDQKLAQTLFGPKKYTRAQGKPSTWTSTFTACNTAASATLKLTNGSGSKSRVSSAVVTLNGVKVIAEKDLNQKVPSLARTVNLKAGLNTLTVTIKSGPGGNGDKDGDDDEHNGGDDSHSDDDNNDPAAVFLILEITGKACGSSDAVPPVISNPQPADGTLLAVARPSISAAFTDNNGGSGIDTASVHITLDGSDITTACSISATGAVCTLTGNLNDGMHSVTVSLADLTKNQASYTWRFSIDTTPPQIAVTSPQNGQNLGSPVVTVTGTVDDASASITVNGIPATLSGQTFTAADVPLTEGANSITVIARDPLGNQATTTLNVTIDTSLPVVTITAPLDVSFTNVPTVTVIGTVGEPAASATVNGRPATLTGQNFTLENLPLAEGQNSITAEALDLAGNKGSAVTTVTLDTVNPQIFVTAPTDGLLTRNPQLTVSGTVSEPLASLLVNGQSVTVNALAFTTTLTLKEGANSIVLNAIDRAGNKGSATLTVTLDSTPPTVPVLEALTSPTNNPIVTVKGSAEVGSSVTLSAGGAQLASTVADSTGLFSFGNISLTEGETIFTAQATDNAGNAGQPSAPLAVILDTVAPSVAIGTPLDGTNLNTPIITVSGSIDDPAALVTVNGLPATNSGGIWTLEGLTLQEGINTLLVEARDPAGNKGSTSATVVLDTVPPVVAITAPVDGLYTNVTQVTVTGTVNEAVASVTVNGTSATLSAGSTPAANTTLTATLTLVEGANNIVVTAVDKAGNTGTATINVTLDTIAPQLTVIGPTDGALLNNGQITFGGSAGEPVVSVLVNGIAAQAGSNGGYTLPVTLAEGNNTLTVTAIDRAGNRSTSTIAVTLDSIAPAAPLLNPIATPTRFATTTVSGQAEANSTVKLFNNGVLISTLSADSGGLFSAADVTLTEGNNPFTATATDAAGNTSLLSAPLTLVLDTKSPVIAIASPTDRLYLNAPAVTVTGSIDDQTATVTVNGIDATISGATFTAIGVPLSDGANILVVTAIDQAGNQATAQVSVTLDTALPVVTITAPLDGSFTAIPAVTVSGTVSEAASTVTVNGKTAMLTGNSFTLENLTLAEGQNTLNAQAVDLAGNKGTAIATVTLDTVNPQIFVATPVDGLLTRNPQLTVTGTVSEPLASLLVNGQPVTVNAQAFTTTLTLNEGTNSIVLTATDRAGNKGTATVNVTLDSTPPVAPVLETLPAITNNPLATLRGSAEAGSSVILYIGDVSSGQTVADNSGLFSFPNITLAEGANTFTAVSLDQAGNTSRISESVVTTLDTKAPLVAIAAPSDKTILNTPVVTVSGSIDDPTAQVTVNGLAALNSGGTWTLEGFTLQEGTNTLLVEARDPAGNKGSVTTTVVLDTVPPVVAITAPVDGLYTNVTAATVSGTISETVASVTINGRAAAITAQSFTLSGLQLAEGVNSITVEATDLAGNKGTATVSVTLDTIAPQLTVIGPADGALLNNGQITFGGSAAEPVTQVTVNGIATQAGTNGGYTLPVTLAEGSNTLTVTATDRAGNSSTSTINVNLDSIAPAAPLLNAQATPTRTATTTVSGQAEANSTVKLFNNGVVIATLTADAAGLFSVADVTLTEGNNPFTATATDAAGNTSALSALLTVVLDTKAPVITVTAPTENAFLSAAQVSVKGSIDEAVATLTINGASTPLSDLKFDQQITLTPGLNSIVLVATDLAGNSSTKTVLVTIDSTPPVVTITAPLSGRITNNAQVTVTGTISKVNTTATINGTAITVANQTFNFVYTLNEGDNSLVVEATDRAGNKGSASVNATLDTQLPQLSLQAPVEAAAGANVAITVTASDNRQLTLVELKADGMPIWSGGNVPSLVEAVSYRLSPALNAGTVVTLQAKGADAAGNEGTATAAIRITQAAMGPGYIQGKVLEDGRGLKLQGAEILITPQLQNSTNSLNSGTDGGYFLETPAGTALVKIAKPGFTSVERLVPVIPEKNITVLDARLTAVSNQKNLVGATGGTVKVDLVSPSALNLQPSALILTFPANALATEADIRLTPVSNQGLAGLLPLGWSPLAAVDVRLLDPATGAALETLFVSPATVKLPLSAAVSIDPSTQPLLARYDESTHSWHVIETVETGSGSATAHLSGAGQYALVVADPAPNAPPVAVAGQELKPSALSLQPDFSLTTTTGKVVPQAAPPSAGLKAAGEVIVTAKDGATPTFTSGLVLNSRITEKFDMKQGDKVEPPVYIQDIILYRLPCVTNIGGGALSAISSSELRTTFPVSPSKDYSIVDLLLGKVGLEIIVPETTENGVMVGTDGGRLVDTDGNILAIPQGALSQTTPVATKTAAAATGVVGSDFTFIKAVEVSLTRQTLATSATLSIPVPSGLDGSLPLIVAKQIDVKGVAKLKLVALAKQSGTFITSVQLAPELTNSTNSINSSGTYYFLQAKAPLGFVTGMVTDSGNAPFNGALVKTDKGSLVDLSASSGKYLVAAPVAAVTATATDLYKNDEGSATSSITAANQALTIDLKILMIPPTVVSVTPTGTNIQPNVPVVVTFSKSMDKNSINASTLKLTSSTGTDIPGVFTFSVDGKTVTLTSSELLTSEKSYVVTIGGGIKDLQGYPLGSDVASGFTVRKTTPPPMPAAGAISGTFPDADGFVTVTATQGSAEAGNTVLLINDTTGEIQSVTPQSNGSFTGKVRAQLGDEIKVVLMDYSGNQTLVSYITYKSDDGKYLVTAKGGKVEGEGGSILDIPDGALAGPTVLKITQLLETALPHPVPEGGKFLGAVNIDSGGFYFQKEAHLSIPVPSDIPVGAVPFLAQPATLTNADGTVEQVYEIIDSTKVINGRLTTASPPFDGVMGFGSFVFLYVTGPIVGDVIVSGTAYRDMDGLPGYTSGVDKPIQGAVIRSPQSANFVSYSKADGRYATFGFAANGSCRNFPIAAVHPQTMFKTTVNITTCDAPYYVNNLNFKLADKDTVLPDKTPPTIDLNMAVASGQAGNPRIIAGTIYTGTEMTLPLSITDQLMGSASLTIGFTAQGTNSAVPIPVTLTASGQGLVSTPAGMFTRYTYSPAFPSGVAGSSSYSFKPMQEGRYDFTVEATDESKNKSSSTISIRAIPQGSSLGSGKEGAPTIDSIVPSDKFTDVMVTSPVIAWFSEPVENVNDTTFVLIDSITGTKVPATVQSGLEGGRMQATLTPKGNLYYGRKYEVRLTNVITDSYPNTDGNKQNLASFSATFTTKVPKGYDLTDTPFASRDIDLYTFTDANGDSRTYAYLSAGTQGWRITNVTDPTVPATIYPTDGKTFPAGFDYRNLAINQDKNIMGMTENITFADGNQYGYVRFYDLNANPANPPIIGREKLAEAYSGIPGRIAMMGDFAYVSTINAGLQVIDITQAITRQTNGQPSDGTAIAGVFDSVGQGYGQPNDIAVYGSNKALLTTTSGNLVVLDVSLPLPQLMAQYQDSNHHPLRVGVAPEYNYLNSFGVQEVKDIGVAGTREGKVVTIDLSDPYNPATIAVTKNESGNDLVTVIREMSVNKEAGLAFITTNSSIQVIDIKDPANPRLLSTIASLPDKDGVLTPLGQIPAIIEKGGWVYLASQNKGLTVVDLDPATVTITVTPIRLATPIKGFSKDLLVPITYQVHEYGDFRPYSANMYVYETTNNTRKVIANFLKIPHKGTNTVQFPAKDIGIEFDVQKKYEVEVLFEDGLAQSLINKFKPNRKRIPLQWQAIATDYNRDGKIDVGDFIVAEESARPFYFWINDNDDKDDVTGNGIPGSGPDWKKTNVSGTRDLVDYFPVHLDIKPLLEVLPPQMYKYILKQEDSALSFVGTELLNTQAKEYLVNVDVAKSVGGAGTAPTGKPKHVVSRSGSVIYPMYDVLEKIQQNGSALLLVEGRFKTDKPLVLEVWDKANNDIAFRTQMALSIDGVEQMFRHKNLTQVGGGPAPVDKELDRLDEPTNSPDISTNGTNFVFVHGYNVNSQQARGWHAEMFKRLYWSGSKAKYWGVTWYGSETQLAGSVTVDYHRNVIHAFDTASALKDFLNTISGNITIAAHSLGNMLVSATLTDYKNIWDSNNKIKTYFMLDAAVAKEAYDGSEAENPDTSFPDINNVGGPNIPCEGVCMDHPGWKYYDQRLYASEWYKLFINDSPLDFRSKLTWRDRFGERPNGTIYYNFYSSGEEVLGGHTGMPSILDTGMLKQTGRYTWALQEKLKGRLYIDFDFVGSQSGGWGFNLNDYAYIDPVAGKTAQPISSIFVNNGQLSDANLRIKPFFSTRPEDAALFNEATGSSEAAKKTIRDRFLAQMIPARTLPAGSNPSKAFSKENNIDMQARFKNNNSWPSQRGKLQNWQHGDVRAVAYPYIYSLFNSIVINGGLQQ